MPGEIPNLKMLALFGCGGVLLRGSGCTVNDLLDRDIDNKVILLLLFSWLETTLQILHVSKNTLRILATVNKGISSNFKSVNMAYAYSLPFGSGMYQIKCQMS